MKLEQIVNVEKVGTGAGVGIHISYRASSDNPNENRGSEGEENCVEDTAPNELQVYKLKAPHDREASRWCETITQFMDKAPPPPALRRTSASKNVQAPSSSTPALLDPLAPSKDALGQVSTPVLATRKSRRATYRTPKAESRPEPAPSSVARNVKKQHGVSDPVLPLKKIKCGKPEKLSRKQQQESARNLRSLARRELERKRLAKEQAAAKKRSDAVALRKAKIEKEKAARADLVSAA
jgi:hypothetical protein